MPDQSNKADAEEHPEVLARVGLPVNKPPAHGGLPFDESSDQLDLDRTQTTSIFHAEARRPTKRWLQGGK
jgi:hypothetical protein